jgi:RNA polymerase sigma-70 factor (ECF subfamily)
MIVDPTEQPGALGAWLLDPKAAGIDAWEWQFELFDTAYRPALLKFVKRVAKDRWLADSELDAEAVVNVTMFRAAARWPQLDRPARWIYTVAANMVRQAYRNRLRRRETTAVLPGWSSTGACGPAVAVAATRTADGRRDGGFDAEARERVEDDVLDLIEPGAATAALADLPVQQRVATYLFDVERWSARQIAEVLGCAEATVPVHVRRGRGRMREQLRIAVTRTVSGAVSGAVRAVVDWIMHQLHL